MADLPSRAISSPALLRSSQSSPNLAARRQSHSPGASGSTTPESGEAITPPQSPRPGDVAARIPTRRDSLLAICVDRVRLAMKGSPPAVNSPRGVTSPNRTPRTLNTPRTPRIDMPCDRCGHVMAPGTEGRVEGAPVSPGKDIPADATQYWCGRCVDDCDDMLTSQVYLDIKTKESRLMFVYVGD